MLALEAVQTRSNGRDVLGRGVGHISRGWSVFPGFLVGEAFPLDL
jgi:hypothetical protein